ncbi:hypothetical protein ACEN9J_02745 [Variovorax sp. Varisp41]|uniref:hypothetical protein n=1 Tax=Variovorax sp. Varisp41 TaxID=3243033 RepID=UPI0039B3A2EB
MTAAAFEEVPMPEANDFRYMSHGHSKRWVLAGAAVPPNAEPLYTADQLRAYGDQRANAALEQAYDAMFSLKGDKVTRFDAQTAIRKLKTDSTTARGCPWTPDSDGYWKTACGKSHSFTDGGPTENNHRFCCYCGGRISMKENGDA